MGEGRVVARGGLQHITINGLWLQCMQRGTKVSLSETRLCLGKAIYVVAGTINVREVSLQSLSEMTVGGMHRAHPLVVYRHVHKVIVIRISTIFHVRGLALELVLNALSVWCIPNKGQNRADTFNKECTLCRVSII